MKSIFLIVFLVAFSWTSWAYPLFDYPVNWTEVTNISFERTLNSPLLGSCVCDITRGLCDPNCCCDPDCSANVKDFFYSCLPEQYGYSPFKTCSGGDLFVHLIQGKKQDTSRISGSGGALCIVKENVPTNVFPYYSVPQKTEISPSKSNFVEQNQSLKVGKLLSLLKLIDTTGEQNFKFFTLLSVPTQNEYGGCTFPGHPVPFLAPVQKSSCVLNGYQICNEFPLKYFLNLYLDNVGYFAPIDINLYASNGTLLQTILASETSTTSSYLSDSVCKNAVTRVRGNIQYNSSMIYKGTYDITLMDVIATQYVPILYEITFTTEGEKSLLNVISGSPGYGIGARLRAGMKVKLSEKIAIAEQEIGFAVPGGGRDCTLNNFKAVRMGYDVISSGCFLSMSELELQSLCSKGSETFLRSIFESSAGLNATVLAQTSDALVNDPSSWINIEGLDASDKPGIYDQIRRRCDNIALGLHFTVVTAKAGLVYNPQTVLVEALAEFQYGSLAIRNFTDLSSSGTSPQYFTFKVSFSSASEQLIPS